MKVGATSFVSILAAVSVGAIDLRADSREWGDQISEALQVVERMTHLRPGQAIPVHVTRQCFVAVDTLLRQSPDGEDGEALRKLATHAEPLCQTPARSRLEQLGLLYLLMQTGIEPQVAQDSTPWPTNADEDEDLRGAVAACWNIGALSSEAQSVSVTVEFSLDMSGIPDGDVSLIRSTSADQAATDLAFQTARRAILRCGATGLDAPAGTHRLTFDPASMARR